MKCVQRKIKFPTIYYIATHHTHRTSVYLPYVTSLIEAEEAFLFLTSSISSFSSAVLLERKINKDGHILNGKSMTLLTLPRCGLMLMWLLLTAGTFDTICPSTIQPEQWLSSSKSVTSHWLLTVQCCLPLCARLEEWRTEDATGGWCQYLTICHYLYLGEIWYSEKRELMSPNMTTAPPLTAPLAA